MEEEFEFTGSYKGHNYLFKSSLLIYHTTHKFEVHIEDNKFIFEPDEEKNYRAIMEPSMIERLKKVDVGLLEAVSFTIKQIVTGTK